MRIAQVAPLVESVPPKHYGGTERIVAYLTEELVRVGHKVTLFAGGDSVTSAELIPVCRRSFPQDKRAKDYLSCEVLLMDHVMQRAGEFDVDHGANLDAPNSLSGRPAIRRLGRRSTRGVIRTR